MQLLISLPFSTHKVVAKTKIIAQKAARAVKVIYEPRKAILTIEEAVEEESYHEQYNRWIIRGDDIDSALEKADFVLEGTTRMGGQ